MKNSIQLIILAALLPFIGTAREETMEERKQRIGRKYLRERMSVAQSEMYVSGAFVEDEQVSASQKYKEVQDAFERQEEGVAVPHRPVSQRKKNKNWLLTDADITADPLDPYGSDESDDMSIWGEEESLEEEQRTSRTKKGYDPYESRNGTLDSSSSITERRVGIFGQRASDSITTEFGNQSSRIYGASQEKKLVKQPFARKETVGSGRSGESQGYTPYKNPYEQKRNQQQLQGTPSRYTKPNSFNQWKERNKTWNPMDDDRRNNR